MFMNVLLIIQIIFGKSDPRDGWQCSWGWNKELQNFPRARRETCQTIGWQIYFTSETETGRRGDAESGKIANHRRWWTMMDYDSFVGDCHWDGLWFSTGSGGKLLKAEIISKTIKHQIAVRRSQSNRQIGGKRGNLTPNEMSTEIASHFSKYWKY